MQAFLRDYDLSELWQGDVQHRPSPALEGFFGPDHYRLTMVITEAHRDARSPATYLVRGKCRYRKNIRVFTGTLTIRQLANAEPYYSPQDNSFDLPASTDTGAAGAQAWQNRYEAKLSQTAFYTLRAQVQLVEALTENSGVFEGEANLNFYVLPSRKVGFAGAPALTEADPTRGTSLLLRGARRNVTTHQVKQFVVADDVFAAAPDVYKDFGVGERGQNINPKYKKLGWDTYWQNDEWWADAPKPKALL